MNEELYSIWENIDIEHRMFFLVNESAQLIWNLCKNGDKNTLKDFRERLRADLSFADDELYELELKDKIKALCKAIASSEINETVADRLSELSEEIQDYLCA